MSGKYGAVNPVGNDQDRAGNRMMEMWQESIRQSQERQTRAGSIIEERQAAEADLQQKIRNGEVECPTCRDRTYQDDSDDGGVSFQSARSISSATAAVRVMSHESEHVSAEDTRARREGGEVLNSSVSLCYATCPMCGKNYVAGGLTKTTTSTPTAGSSREQERQNFRPGGLDASV